MLAAGLLARKAIAKGLSVPVTVKTSLAPGSRVVTEYLDKTGLQKDLDRLGFQLVGYGCTTCIGNSGPLDGPIEHAIEQGDLVAASVLSGNRNFEARVHSSIRANFLMSPPLVVAYALAGTVEIDLENDPIGTGEDGSPVYLRDIWPSHDEVQEAMTQGIDPEMYRRRYSDILDANPQWKEIDAASGALYDWDQDSTYIQLPPFFEGFEMEPKTIKPFADARALAILGDSTTTDHISPAGAIKEDSPAGRYLIEHGVEKKDFNSYGSRRGNDRVMTRGTFANVRIRNLMADGREGGWTKLMPDGQIMAIYDACQKYRERGEPLIVFAGADYGMGSSRDWAAKGTNLLGVRAVVAKSYERIHRSNLIGMGVLPLQFADGEDATSLGFDGSETFSCPDLGNDLKTREKLTLTYKKADGIEGNVSVIARVDTNVEIEYYRHGGILPYVLRRLIRSVQ
jgi:aconitate hydratase